MTPTAFEKALDRSSVLRSDFLEKWCSDPTRKMEMFEDLVAIFDSGRKLDAASATHLVA